MSHDDDDALMAGVEENAIYRSARGRTSRGRVGKALPGSTSSSSSGIAVT